MTSTTGRLTQLGYIGIGVSDVPAWDGFLTDILGLALGGKTANGTALYRMDELRGRVHIRPSGEDDVVYLGWFVDSATDLATVTARIEATGHPVERCGPAEAAERGVLGLARVRDPLGLVNEIAYGPALHDRPFVPGRHLDAGFLTGDMGFGHVVLLGGTPEANTAFYVDLLGLRVTDVVATEGGKPAVFLRANARHHSLAFPLDTVPPGVPRMQHLMVETVALDDVGRGQDVAEAGGVLEVRLGRHGNDRMVSCYMRSPSGWGVEYGWGAVQVPGDAPVVQHTGGDVWGHQLARTDSLYSDLYG